jgi:hypothetical protein
VRSGFVKSQVMELFAMDGGFELFAMERGSAAVAVPTTPGHPHVKAPGDAATRDDRTQ